MMGQGLELDDGTRVRIPVWLLQEAIMPGKGGGVYDAAWARDIRSNLKRRLKDPHVARMIYDQQLVEADAAGANIRGQLYPR